MVKHKRWHFFIIQFIADDKRHTARVGAASKEDAHELIFDMYSDDGPLRIISSKEVK